MAKIIDIGPRLEAQETKPRFEVRGVPCSVVNLERARRGSKAEGPPEAVLLIDGFVVGRLAEIAWLAGNGWRLISVSRPPIEASSLKGVVRAWLEKHGAPLLERQRKKNT